MVRLDPRVATTGLGQQLAKLDTLVSVPNSDPVLLETLGHVLLCNLHVCLSLDAKPPYVHAKPASLASSKQTENETRQSLLHNQARLTVCKILAH